MLTFPQDLDIYSSPMMGGSLRNPRVPSYPLPLRKETYNAMSISNTSPKGLAATCRGQGLGFSQIAVQEMRLDALCGLDSCRDWYLGVPRFESKNHRAPNHIHGHYLTGSGFNQRLPFFFFVDCPRKRVVNHQKSLMRICVSWMRRWAMGL